MAVRLARLACFCSHTVYMHYLSQVEGVEPERLSLLKAHDLDEGAPGGEVALGDCIVEVSDAVVRVGGGQTIGLLHTQVLYALVRLKSQ